MLRGETLNVMLHLIILVLASAQHHSKRAHKYDEHTFRCSTVYRNDTHMSGVTTAFSRQIMLWCVTYILREVRCLSSLPDADVGHCITMCPRHLFEI